MLVIAVGLGAVERKFARDLQNLNKVSFMLYLHQGVCRGIYLPTGNEGRTYSSLEDGHTDMIPQPRDSWASACISPSSFQLALPADDSRNLGCYLKVAV